MKSVHVRTYVHTRQYRCEGQDSEEIKVRWKEGSKEGRNEEKKRRGRNKRKKETNEERKNELRKGGKNKKNEKD